MTLSERARRVREDRKLTQQALADRASVTRSRVQALEDGKNVTLETIDKVFAALDLHLVAVTTEEMAALHAGRELLGRFLPLTSHSAPVDEHLDVSPELREQIRQARRAFRARRARLR